jgi:hypothetical protein
VATRHNLCQNPACSVNITGWQNQGALPPVRVTGLTGFPVTTGARYDTNGTFLRTQLGAASPGVQYTLSCYILAENFTANGNIYIEWVLSAGGPTYAQVPYSAPVGVVTRISITGVAPANTLSAAIIIDGGNFSSTPRTVTAVLIEAAAATAAYFDGDFPNATWDGTTGLSSSTLTDGPVTVTGSASMSLGALTETATGQVTVLGTGSMPLGGLTASETGQVTVLGAAAANLGALSQTATGQRTTHGAATMNLGRLAMNATNVTGGPVILPDDFYTPGPCRPYDYVSFCDIPLESAAVSGYALQAASEIIFFVTAQRFDTCQVTLRMCRRTCYGSYFPYGWWEYGYGGPRPALINGQWYNIVCGACGDGCSCSIVSEVMLPGPVQSIVQVTVDGEVLEEGVDYRLDDYRKLVRLGGNQWPVCNNLNLGITEVGTWSVTMLLGEPLPTLGKLAVGELFCDILADLAGGDCKVPYTVTQLTRQGVTLTFETIQEALKEGFQGLKYTDKFIATYNPDHIRARPYMIDMDGNEPGRVTGTTII